MQQNYIAGQWLDGSGASINRNPSDLSDEIGRYAQADAGQVERAVSAAAEAAPQWGLSNPQLRADALDRIGT